MKSQILITLLLAMLISSSGCQMGLAQRPSTIHDGGKPYTAIGDGFTVTLPEGWRFIERPFGRVLAIIKNERQQRIIIKYTELKDPLPWTKRILTPDLDSSALADALTEDIRAAESTLDLTILESGPVIIDGSAGCRVIARFRNRELDDAEVIKVFYGTIYESRLYMLIYDALVGNNFEQGLPAFEETVKSFRFGTHRRTGLSTVPENPQIPETTIQQTKCSRWEGAWHLYWGALNPIKMQVYAIDECKKGDPAACISVPFAIPFMVLVNVFGFPLLYPIFTMAPDVQTRGCPK